MTIELREVHFNAPTAIDGYGPGGFRVGGHWVDGAVFVTGEQMVPWSASEGGPTRADAEALTEYLNGLDVVLMGLGADQRMIPPEIQTFFDERNIGVEPMATPAAARTFNVLLGEGRRVGAALMVV